MAIRLKPLPLLILDGFGIRAEKDYNAIALTNTPCLNALQKNYPMTSLNFSGAVETIDGCLKKVVNAIEQVGGYTLLTADHGNIERMIDPVTRQPHTTHSSNPLPLVSIGIQQPA